MGLWVRKLELFRERCVGTHCMFFHLFLQGYNLHGGELRDILHIYSDRTGKNIHHYFLNAQ